MNHLKSKADAAGDEVDLTLSVTWSKIGMTVRRCLAENTGVSIRRCLLCVSPARKGVMSNCGTPDGVQRIIPVTEASPGPSIMRFVLWGGCQMT